MSWGSYAYLNDSIELAQAATVKLPDGTGVMISGQFVLTAAHVVIENNELAPNQTAIIFGERPERSLMPILILRPILPCLNWSLLFRIAIP